MQSVKGKLLLSDAGPEAAKGLSVYTINRVSVGHEYYGIM